MKRAIFGTIIVSCIACSLSAAYLASAVVPGTNTRIDKVPIVGSNSFTITGDTIMSANGKQLVFAIGGVQGHKGIYSQNLKNGSFERIDVSTAGTLPDVNRQAIIRAVSATGRYILFSSRATNLIDGRVIQVDSTINYTYLRDTVENTTELISQNSDGVVASMHAMSVSSDGRFILIETTSPVMHPQAGVGGVKHFVIDREQDTISPVAYNIETGNPAGTSDVSMNCDGSLFAFTSSANAQPSATRVHVWILDKRGEEDKYTDITPFMESQNPKGAVAVPSISCSGDYVGFVSSSPNVNTGVSVNYIYNVHRPYIYDRINQSYHLAAQTPSGESSDIAGCNIPYHSSCRLSISDDGEASFLTRNNSLAGADDSQVYIYSIEDDNTELISRDINGSAGNDDSSYATISRDGEKVFYGSFASNLVSGDQNGNGGDAFVSETGL